MIILIYTIAILFLICLIGLGLSYYILPKKYYNNLLILAPWVGIVYLITIIPCFLTILKYKDFLWNHKISII